MNGASQGIITHPFTHRHNLAYCKQSYNNPMAMRHGRVLENPEELFEANTGQSFIYCRP